MRRLAGIGVGVGGGGQRGAAAGSAAVGGQRGGGGAVSGFVKEKKILTRNFIQG